MSILTMVCVSVLLKVGLINSSSNMDLITMIIDQSKNWETFLFKRLDELISCPRIEFSRVKPKLLPKRQGVYLITKIDGLSEEAFYIGRTTNLQQRLYNNHLMGPLSNARLKKYLIDDGTCKDKDEAKQFIKKYCAMRWIEEIDLKTRRYTEYFLREFLDLNTSRRSINYFHMGRTGYLITTITTILLYTTPWILV